MPWTAEQFETESEWKPEDFNTPTVTSPEELAQLRANPETIDLRQAQPWLNKPTAIMRPEQVQEEYEDIGRTPQEKALAERVRESQRNLPPREAGLVESLGAGFSRTFEPLGTTPYLLSASDKELESYVLAKQQESKEAPQPTGLGSIGETLGSVAGGVAYYGGAGARGGLPGLAVAGAVQTAAEAFERASQSALAEGKSPAEAVVIGKAAMGIGAVGGAVMGPLGPARVAGSLKAAALKQGVPFGAAAGAERIAQNIAQQQLGLQTPTTEGALEAAVMQAVVPPIAHGVGAGLGAATERTTDASRVSEAGKLDAPVREQPIEIKQEVPTQEGGQGVQPRVAEPAGTRPDQAPAGEAKGGLLLETTSEKRAHKAVSPDDFVPALRPKGKEPIAGKKGQIHQDIYNAQGDIEGKMLRVEQPEHGFMHGDRFITKEELGGLLGEKGSVDSQRLIELQKKTETTPPKTATFSGMQLGLPQFRYKDPVTGRFNDVSAETAQKRGYSISPEESAKARAAQNPRSAEAAFIDVGAVAEAATKGVEAVATNLRARGNLPPEAFAAKEAASGEIQRADKVIKQLGGDLMKELGKVYGLNFLQKAAGGSRKIPAVDVQRMDAYLKGDHSQGPAINPNVRGVLDNMRATITGLSERVIHELQAQGGNDPLIQRIQDNLDVYVTRSYKFFDSKKPADKWYFELPDSVRNAAEQFAQQPRPNGTIPTPEEARASIMNWLSDLKDNASQRQSGTLGSKDLSQFMKRGTITAEMRAVLGEYKDPLTNFAKSTTKMTDWLANQQFLNDVKDAGLGRWIYPEGQAPPGFNVKIAAEGSDTMSPLNGMRTTPEIAQALQDIRGQRGNPSWYAKAWYTLNAITKSAATTQSVLTQARNAWGQPFFAGMGGYWHVGKFPDALRAIITDVGFNANQTRRVYLQNAAKRGVINDSPRAAELMEILKDANLNDINTPGDLTSFSLARLAKKAYFKLPAEIYKIADDLGKLYYWENEKVNVRKVHPAWTPEQVDIEGAARVRNFVPTYSKAGAAIRGLRKWPISPFPSFFSEVIRTSFNAMGQSISELRSANPIERSIGAKRFASQLATLSAGYALSAFTRSMFNVSKQEEEDLRRFQPSWSKNSQFVFTGREKGKLNFVNFSYQNPYSQLIDPLISVASSVKNDTPFVEAAAGAVGEFFRPFVSEEMLTAALIDAKRGETSTGRKVWDDIDPPGVKAWKGADHIAMTFAPGTVQRLRKRIIPAFTKEQPPYGRKLEPTREVLSEISGIRAESFDFQNGLAFKARQFREDIQEAEGKFRSPAHEPSTPPGTLIDKYRQAQEMRYGLWSELRKDYLAALRSGISTNDATRAIMAMDLSKTMAGSVQNGVYVPWVPGDETLGRIPKANLPPLVEAIKATVKEYKGKGPK